MLSQNIHMYTSKYYRYRSYRDVMQIYDSFFFNFFQFWLMLISIVQMKMLRWMFIIFLLGAYLSSIHAAHKPRYNNKNHIDAKAILAAAWNSVNQILFCYTLSDSRGTFTEKTGRDGLIREIGIVSVCVGWAYLRDLSKSTQYQFTIAINYVYRVRDVI